MSFRDDLRKLIDPIRGGIPGEMGLRPHRVDVVVRAWDGGAVGLGNATVTSTRITNRGYNPKVAEVTNRDVARSGGLYQMGDLRIEPVTPTYPGGGTAESSLDPSYVGAREVYYLIRGPGMGTDDSAWCTQVESTATKSFRQSVVVRRVATLPNITAPT